MLLYKAGERMRSASINPQLFIQNRASLRRLLAPNALAVVNANDILPTNADGTLLLRCNSDLFYLAGIEQEESVLLLYPDAHEEKLREILFLREANPLMETWEGHKLTKEEARKTSGIDRVEWLSEFRPLFHRLMCECEHVYLNSTNTNAPASSSRRVMRASCGIARRAILSTSINASPNCCTGCGSSNPRLKSKSSAKRARLRRVGLRACSSSSSRA